jgi:hypothetical protein
MASILALTSLDLRERDKARLSRALISGLGEIFPDAMSFSLKAIPPEYANDMAKNQTTFIICLPQEYLPIEVKRAAALICNDVLREQAGVKGRYKAIVLFWYHDVEDLGKDGELFSDLFEE